MNIQLSAVCLKLINPSKFKILDKIVVLQNNTQNQNEQKEVYFFIYQ